MLISVRRAGFTGVARNPRAAYRPPGKPSGQTRLWAAQHARLTGGIPSEKNQATVACAARRLPSHRRKPGDVYRVPLCYQASAVAAHCVVLARKSEVSDFDTIEMWPAHGPLCGPEPEIGTFLELPVTGDSAHERVVATRTTEFLC